MAETAAKVAYKVWHDLGKIDTFEEFVATDGSTTTIVNGKIADRQDRPEDNYSIDYTAIVVRDAGGASAAPEGEMQRINAFNSSTYTHTLDTALSAAVASGDFIAIANADIPLREMYRIINRALANMGEIPLIDTTLITATQQTEYDLPVALKREDLLRVEIQGYIGDSNNNQWLHVPKFDVIPSTPGTIGTLVIPQYVSNRTIRLTYRGVHPVISGPTSTISEYIHPSVVTAACVKQALRWMNANTGGGDNYWLQRENEAAQDFEDALKRHPIWEPKHTPKYYSAHTTTTKDAFAEPPQP